MAHDLWPYGPLCGLWPVTYGLMNHGICPMPYGRMSCLWPTACAWRCGLVALRHCGRLSQQCRLLAAAVRWLQARAGATGSSLSLWSIAYDLWIMTHGIRPYDLSVAYGLCMALWPSGAAVLWPLGSVVLWPCEKHKKREKISNEASPYVPT